MEGRQTLGRSSTADLMHRLLLPLYLLPLKSYKTGYKKTTLLQTNLFVDDQNVEKLAWRCLDGDTILVNLLPGKGIWYGVVLSFYAQREKTPFAS